MFDEKTKQSLKYYVYMLVDPKNNIPFYIGKGSNDRLFQHLDCALSDEDISNVKYETIRKIQDNGGVVGHVIVRHGLTEEQAFEVEASLIDAFNFSGILLSNKVGGHNSIEKGLMTCEEVKGLYNAEPLDDLPQDCVIININRKYERGYGENAIYNATKGTWAINKAELQDSKGNILRKYVLSEYKGLIVEVFKVSRWFTQMREYNPTAKRHGQMRSGMAFEGAVAEPSVRNQYINKSIAHRKLKGSASAHRFNL
ncbi:hypothetical protein GCM10027592_46900 [Spirosoma flavus]